MRWSRDLKMESERQQKVSVEQIKEVEQKQIQNVISSFTAHR